MEKLFRVKWENIFAIITGLILTSMTIRFFMINGFDFNLLMFDLLYVGIIIAIIRWSIKLSRRFFLSK